MTGLAPTSPWPQWSLRQILPAIFALGFSCVITQLVLMREALGAFEGNELVLGVMLGNWLLTMGLGASLGRWTTRLARPVRTLAMILIGIAVIPAAQVVALRGLRHFAFLRGAALGVTETVLASFVVLAPYCLLAGFALTLACSILVREKEPSTGSVSLAAGPSDPTTRQGAGWVYTLDSLGSIVGGALFSFGLVLWLDHFATLWLPGVVSVLAAVSLVWLERPERSLAGLCLVAGAAVFPIAWLLWLWQSTPDRATTAMQLPGQHLLFLGTSPYGRFTVTTAAGQTNFFENGLLLASSPNIEPAEESAHYAMAQRPRAQRVLLIGGLFSGIATEVLRYSVRQLDCVDIDPVATRLAREFSPKEFNAPRVRVFEADARQYVRTTPETYDVVIVALPDPATAQLNRFYTSEFFREVRRIMPPGGLLSFAVGRYENYASPELRRLLSCARQTAAGVFRNVALVPGGRVYFLASDAPLTLDIATALENQGLALSLVNRHYLNATLTADRLADVERASGQPSPPNRDFKPILYILQLRHWASQFSPLSTLLTVLLLALTAAYVVRLRRSACVIFASGFAGAALEIVLLFGLQVIAGSVYQQVGLVVTLFMVGLAVGAGLAMRWLARQRRASRVAGCGGAQPVGEAPRGRTESILCLLAVILAVLAFALPRALVAVTHLSSMHIGASLVLYIIAFFGFILAFMTGLQFPIANRVEQCTGLAAARLYTADFIGASIGALLTSTLLIPWLGITGVCWLVGAMNLSAAPMVFWKGRTG